MFILNQCLPLQCSIHYKLKGFVLTLHIKVSTRVDWWTQTIVRRAPIFSSVILERKKFQNFSCAHNLAIFKPGHYWAWIPRSSTVEHSFMAFYDGVVSWSPREIWQNWRHLIKQYQHYNLFRFFRPQTGFASSARQAKLQRASKNLFCWQTFTISIPKNIRNGSWAKKD